MFCCKCGKQLPDDAKFCTYCGYSIENLAYVSDTQNHIKINSQYNNGIKKWYEKSIAIFFLFICFWPIGLLLLWTNQYIKKGIKLTITSIFLLLVIFVIVGSELDIFPKGEILTESQTVTKEEINIDNKKQNKDSKENSTNETSQEIPDKSSVEEKAETEINVDSLPESEYKAQCETLWHDDIFFSVENLEGKYVKLDLFVEESYFFEAESIYNSLAADFIKEFDLQRDFYKCGIQRENDNSYMGGQIKLYFSNSCGYSASDMNIGDHLIVYGKIIDYSTYSSDGYNTCSVIPKYIDNNGQ